MSTILKENENSVVTASPSATAAVPGAPVAKSGAEEQARPQPVALEVPVTVNGARTVEGSDKREPFSETTKTVLVFGHGAVVRISSALAPGQLIFLTNEKTKKEVVCQVVKSKSQGPANGYVELRFTEPAPGYWGMRFPAGNSPVATVAPRPAAPTSLKPVAATPAVIAPAPPAIVPAAPMAVTPVVPAAVTPVAPAKPVVAPVEQNKEILPAIVAEAPRAVEPPQVIEAAKIAETQSAATEKIAPAKVEAVATTSPEKIAAAETVASIPKVAIGENPSLDDLAKQLTKELLQSSLKESTKETAQAAANESGAEKIEPEAVTETAAKIPANVLEPAAKVIPAVEPAPTSSDELKQKAAQLQQQLGSLLFADSKQQPDANGVQEAAISSEASQKVVESAKADAAAPTQPVNSKPSAPPQKPMAQSIEAEEVKIPSWLAPLARESDFRTAEPTSAASTTTDSEANSATSLDGAEVSAALEDAQHKQESPMFGGQLITDSPAAGETAGGSKKGLWIGIAASALLLAGGGAWYAKQPDSLLAGIFSSTPATAAKTVAAKTSSNETPFRNEVSQQTGGRASAAVPNAAPAKSSIAAPIPNTSSTNATAAVSFPSAKNSGASPGSAAATTANPPEQPKKPKFGDVHLATPSIKRAGGSTDSNSAEPAIENNSAAGADSLSSVAAGNHGGPAIPLPVGGEVKQAKLLKAVPPVYPAAAKSQHVSGDVKLDALIDTHGKVTSAKVLSGPGLLHQAAADAVKQWQYEPALLNGQSTSMHLTVTVQFRLQ